MSMKNGTTKKLRNRCLILWGIITISILLYKNYNYVHVPNIKNNKVISTNEVTKDKGYKNQSFKKYDTNNSEEDIDENTYKKKDENADKDINNEANLLHIMEKILKKMYLIIEKNIFMMRKK